MEELNSFYFELGADLKGPKAIPNRNNFFKVSHVALKRFKDRYKDRGIYWTFCWYDKVEGIEDNSPSVENSAIVADLCFDFDAVDIEHARIDAVYTINHLLRFSFPLSSINIFFSGSKGFHLEISKKVIGLEPRFNLLDLYKKLVENIRDLSPHKTIDLKIYERRRLWRVPNTIHEETGLYKIPLSFDELKSLSISEIKKLAKSKRNFKRYNGQVVEILRREFLNVEKILLKEKEKKFENWVFTPEQIKMLPCISRILNEDLGEGIRNDTLYNLALFFKNRKVKKDEAKSVLRLWAKRQGLKSGEIVATIDSAYKSSFHWGCQNPFVQNFCDHKHCPLGFMKTEIDSLILPYEEIVDNFSKFAFDKRNICKIDTGIDVLDEKLGGIFGGELVVVGGTPGVGKSEWAASVALHNAMLGRKVCFLSLEMPNEIVVSRFLEAATNLPWKTIAAQSYKKDQKELLQKAIHELKDKHIPFYFLKRGQKYKPSFLKEVIERVINRFGLELLVVDHLRLLSKEGNRKDWEEVEESMKLLAFAAQEYDIAIMPLVHFNRGDDSQPRSMRDALGGSGIENSATKFIQVWHKPVPEGSISFGADIKTKFVIQKSRMGGETGTVVLWYDRFKHKYFEQSTEEKLRQKEGNQEEELF